jgi:hypothetical protein
MGTEGICWLARDDSEIVEIVWGQTGVYFDLEMGIEFALRRGKRDGSRLGSIHVTELRGSFAIE